MLSAAQTWPPASALRNADGTGILMAGTPTLHFDALRFSVADLEQAKRAVDLEPRNEITVHLDGRHCGLGGDTGWYPNIHPEYLITPGRYQYTVLLRAIGPGEDPGSLARQLA